MGREFLSFFVEYAKKTAKGAKNRVFTSILHAL